jgi:hypothetical protein
VEEESLVVIGMGDRRDNGTIAPASCHAWVTVGDTVVVQTG